MNPGATPPPGGRAADGAGAARGSTDAVPARRVPPPRRGPLDVDLFHRCRIDFLLRDVRHPLPALPVGALDEAREPRHGRVEFRGASGRRRQDGPRETPNTSATGRGQVLVCNHQSWFDVFALSASLPVEFSFVGKKELSRVPVLGQAWEKVGHVAIDRSDRKSAIESLKRVEEQFRAGRTIIMFPEGTRSPTGELARFKKGAFVMAIKCQVPVVPVAVSGTGTIMRKGDWVIEPGTATIRVGSPISTRGLTQRDRNR